MLVSRPRRIRTQWENDAVAYGFAIQTFSPELVEIAGQVGLHYVWIDGEHGCFGLSEIRELVRAADTVGIDSIVRVATHEPSFVQRVLDLGATGIIAPHVRTVDEAAALVRSCHYAPSGIRGACPWTRAVGHLSTDWPGDRARADEDVLVFGLIEDPEGVENVEAIATRSGLDGLLFGPMDLSMDRGLDGSIDDAEIEMMHQRVVAACRDGGVQYMVVTVEWEGEAIRTSVSQIVTVIGDRQLVFDNLSRSFRDVMMIAEGDAG